MVTEGKIYFLSRPRRFGKSLLVSTLKYYFGGERELFRGLAIEDLEQEWEQYPVFHIDFNSTNYTKGGDTLPKLIRGIIEEWEKQYGYEGNPNFDDGKRFVDLLAHVHRVTGKQCVVLIDEYDKPLLDVLDSGRTEVVGNGREVLVEDINRETLKGFYSAFKAADQDLRFVLLTGVTKFSQVSVFSGFNQPEDISMSAAYEAVCGITEAELEGTFHDEMDAMADEMGVSPEEVRLLLKRHYDGYHFSKRKTDIFNPFSLLNALSVRDIQDYWFRTGTPSYLVRLLHHTDENLNELTGKYYDTSDFIDYRADVERPLPMIYQSGYLTIKDYNAEFENYTLGFPNREVEQGFLRFLLPHYASVSISKSPYEIQCFVGEVRKGDVDGFLSRLQTFFDDTPYELARDREVHYQNILYIVFKLMGFHTEVEYRTSRGRVDLVLKTSNYIYVMEFKLNGTAEEAMQQIEEKGYASAFASDSRKVIKVGVNFSDETRSIERWIVA